MLRSSFSPSTVSARPARYIPSCFSMRPAEKRGEHDAARGGELDEVEAAEGGGVLVLAATADPQVCPLHGVGELGDFVLVQAAAHHLGPSADDGYRHRGRAAHSAPRRGGALEGG